MIRRTNQGGSVASFIVIGVILVVGLLSTIYFLNQRGQQVRKDQTTVADDKTETPKPKTTDSSASKSSGSTSTQSSADGQTTNTQSSGLPATGNETSIINLVSIFLLTSSFIAFMMSRRNQVRSL